MILSDEDKILIKSLYLKAYTANRLTDKFPERTWTKCGVNKVFKELRDTGTVNRRPGSGRPRSARTEENAKLLLQKFPRSATDFVPPIVRWSDREHLFIRKENEVSGIYCGKFWSWSLVRFMREAQFASVSSCARRLLKHFRCKIFASPHKQSETQTTDEYPPPMISRGQSCGSAACFVDSWLNSELSQHFLKCGHKLMVKVNKYKNSSGDEIANVNFFYNIAHVGAYAHWTSS